MSNKMKFDSFEKSLRSSLESVEVTPTSQTWRRIEASLDGVKPLALLLPLVRWGGAVAAAVALALAINIWFIPSEKIEPYGTLLISEFVELEDLPITLEPIDLSEPLAHFVVVKEESVDQGGVVGVAAALTKEPQDSQQAKQSVVATAEDEGGTTEPNSARTVARATKSSLALPRVRKPLNISLFYSEGATTNSFATGTTGAGLADAAPNLAGCANAPSGYFNLISNRHYSPKSVNHRPPITLAMSVAYGIGERWSVESGVGYSRLVSDLEMTYSSQIMIQKIELLGIPLRLNYDIYTTNNFSLYVSAGGQIERLISSKLNSTPIDENLWHLSADGALGAQYSINRWLGVYLEPELRYYFTPTQLTTIRTEFPLNLNMRFGLRFTL